MQTFNSNRNPHAQMFSPDGADGMQYVGLLRNVLVKEISKKIKNTVIFEIAHFVR